MIKWTTSVTSTPFTYVTGYGKCDLCPSKAIGRHVLSQLRVCQDCYRRLVKWLRSDLPLSSFIASGKK